MSPLTLFLFPPSPFFSVLQSTRRLLLGTLLIGHLIGELCPGHPMAAYTLLYFLHHSYCYLTWNCWLSVSALTHKNVTFPKKGLCGFVPCCKPWINSAKYLLAEWTNKLLFLHLQNEDSNFCHLGFCWEWGDIMPMASCAFWHLVGAQETLTSQFERLVLVTSCPGTGGCVLAGRFLISTWRDLFGFLREVPFNEYLLHYKISLFIHYFLPISSTVVSAPWLCQFIGSVTDPDISGTGNAMYRHHYDHIQAWTF